MTCCPETIEDQFNEDAQIEAAELGLTSSCASTRDYEDFIENKVIDKIEKHCSTCPTCRDHWYYTPTPEAAQNELPF